MKQNNNVSPWKELLNIYYIKVFLAGLRFHQKGKYKNDKFFIDWSYFFPRSFVGLLSGENDRLSKRLHRGFAAFTWSDTYRHRTAWFVFAEWLCVLPGLALEVMFSRILSKANHLCILLLLLLRFPLMRDRRKTSGINTWSIDKDFVVFVLSFLIKVHIVYYYML